MDWRRIPFTSKVRAFRDNDTAAGVVWYPVAKGAPALGRSSAIAVPNWDDRTWEWAGTVGEYTAKLEARGDKPRVIANYDHVCGTDEDFREGGHYDDVAPPVKYGAQGLPACCNPPVVGKGGLVLGGRGSVSYAPLPARRGGVVLGGKGDVVYYPPGPTGGTSCVDAPLIPIPSTLTAPLTTAAAQWWKFLADGVHQYRLVAPGEDETTLSVAFFRGTCPGFLIAVSTTHADGSDTWTTGTPPAGIVWVKLQAISVNHNVTFTISQV